MLNPKTYFALVLAIAPLAAPCAGASTMPNCDLRSAPQGAKRQAVFGGDLLIYPAKIGASYTGCQMAWMEDGSLLSATYFHEGKAAWLKGRDPQTRKAFYCTYENGALNRAKSDADLCPEDVKP